MENYENKNLFDIISFDKTTATGILGMRKPPKPWKCWRDKEYDKAVVEKDLLYQETIQRNTRSTKEYQNKGMEVVKLNR
uniref:Uncharacterized protein n=1 Tax=Megaselia scalaris TaxID=36166 RepID=T1GIB2_MEGSC